VLHSLSINYPMLYKFEAMVGLGGGAITVAATA
jgi:hypothetical protein